LFHDDVSGGSCSTRGLGELGGAIGEENQGEELHRGGKLNRGTPVGQRWGWKRAGKRKWGRMIFGFVCGKKVGMESGEVQKGGKGAKPLELMYPRDEWHPPHVWRKEGRE